jgi:hypothetical protein
LQSFLYFFVIYKGVYKSGTEVFINKTSLCMLHIIIITAYYILIAVINSCAKSTWYARHQHSYNICKDFLLMGLYSSICRRFFVCRTVNWEPLGQFTSNFAQLLELIVLWSVYFWWNLDFSWERKSLQILYECWRWYHNTSRLKDGRIKTTEMFPCEKILTTSGYRNQIHFQTIQWWWHASKCFSFNIY